MGRLLMLAPTPIASIYANRGVDAELLLTPDPQEVWADIDVGASASIEIDLGSVRPIDTIFLGAIGDAAAAASWSITGGAANFDTLIQAETALRAPDAAGQTPTISHAFWTGAALDLRYIRLTIAQPIGQPPLTAGVVMVGKAFVASFGHEWGAGRKVIDTGSATPLPSGGFAVVEGVRKGAYSWTFGDLSKAETDMLYAIQLDRGETRPLLVAEDPASTPGLRWRLHYGKLTSLRQYERRNAVQTRWEMTVEEWGSGAGGLTFTPAPDPAPTPTPTPAPSFSDQPSISHDGSPIVGELLTGNDGTIANGAVSARAWLLAGTPIGGATGQTHTPASAGDYEYRVTATGAGGSTSATSAAVAVGSAPPAADNILLADNGDFLTDDDGNLLENA